MLPSEIGGSVTQEVGYFHEDPCHIAAWLGEGLGDNWDASIAGWQSLAQVRLALEPTAPLSRYACIGVDGWTIVLNNGPSGTDVGVLPSLAARKLGIRAIRAVCVDDDAPGFAARILTVYGPNGASPLAIERSIAAADDGGRWIFETSGNPFEFEDTDVYRRRPKSRRFTCRMLLEYLRALDVPCDAEPDWLRGILVERRS